MMELTEQLADLSTKYGVTINLIRERDGIKTCINVDPADPFVYSNDGDDLEKALQDMQVLRSRQPEGADARSEGDVAQVHEGAGTD